MSQAPRPEFSRKADMLKLEQALGGKWQYQKEKGYYFCYFTPAVRDLMGARLGQAGIGHHMDAPYPGPTEQLALCLTPPQVDTMMMPGKLQGYGSLLSRMDAWRSTDHAERGR